MSARRRILCAVIIAALVLALASESFAQEKRTALVIGNAAYRTLPSLKNAANDANDLASKLSALGFEVIKVTDATQEAMETAIRKFGARLGDSDVGLFYYSGHGVQSNGVNYLIPVDANVKAEIDLRYKTVQADFLLDYMSGAGSKLNIVILDACRDNPFTAFRTATRGLAIVSAPRGSVVVYSTSPGSVAEDGAGRNGTFTSALLKEIDAPGLDMKQMFDRVGRGVQGATGGKQIPWVLSSYFGTFQFAAPPLAATDKSSPATSSPASTMTVGKSYGTVKVQVKTNGKVFVDGQEKGQIGPSAVGTISGIEAGNRSIEVRYADGHIERSVLSVASNETATAMFSYVPPGPAASSATAATAATAEVAPVPGPQAVEASPGSSGSSPPSGASPPSVASKIATIQKPGAAVGPEAAASGQGARPTTRVVAPNATAAATGEIVFDWLPKGATVSLDGKSLGPSMSFASALQIEGLLPRQYSVSVAIPDAGVLSGSVLVAPAGTTPFPSKSLVLVGYQKARADTAGKLRLSPTLRTAGWVTLSIGGVAAIATGAFYLLGRSAYSAYAGSTSVTDAANYRNQAETYSYLMIGSAVAGVLGLTVGGGMIAAFPSPAVLEAKIKDLDRQIALMSEVGE